MKNKYNTIIFILLALFLGLLVAIGFQFAKYAKGRAVYGDIKENFVTAVEADGSPMYHAVDWLGLQSTNPDIVGWIYLPDSIIDYPVVQGTDNEFYLHHDFKKHRNAAGAIFIDTANAAGMTDDNTIIYGHHMRDGSMFRRLKKYKAQAYFDEHKIIYYYTPEQNYEIHVFAAYNATAGEAYTQIDMGADKMRLLDEFVGKSDIITGVRPNSEDKIVTLVTCDYNQKDARYIVQGVLKERG